MKLHKLDNSNKRGHPISAIADHVFDVRNTCSEAFESMR